MSDFFRERRFEGVDPGIVTIQQRLEASFGEKAAEAEDTEAALVSLSNSERQL